MKNTITQKSGQAYKDTFFRKLFGDSKNFLELYNAVADAHYPDDTVVTPCPSNDLLARFNDLAACIGNQLIVFFEHQSQISTNMPLRLLPYVHDILYSQIIDMNKLYSSAQIHIPAPKFYVLYNGKQKLKTHVIRLSDAFIYRDCEPAMELVANVIDINLESGEDALNRSNTLQGYSFLIEEIRKNQLSGMTRDNAIKTAINKCIGKDILKAFLTEYYQEVAQMLNWEYDAEAEKKVLTEEAIQEGLQQGAERLAKLIKDGMPLDAALEKVKGDACI